MRLALICWSNSLPQPERDQANKLGLLLHQHHDLCSQQSATTRAPTSGQVGTTCGCALITSRAGEGGIVVASALCMFAATCQGP
jgi:hypothetical protein